MDEMRDKKRDSGPEEPSARDQLEGKLGEIDKLVMMMGLIKSLISPSPTPSPTAGLPPPPPPGVGLGGPPPMGPPMPGPMGPGGPPPMGPSMGGMGLAPGSPPMGPSLELQQALMASKGLV